MSEVVDVVMVESEEPDATVSLAEFVKKTEGLHISMSVEPDE